MSTEAWEATNAHLVASALVAAATIRARDPRLPLARGFPRCRRGFPRSSRHAPHAWTGTLATDVPAGRVMTTRERCRHSTRRSSPTSSTARWPRTSAKASQRDGRRRDQQRDDSRRHCRGSPTCRTRAAGVVAGLDVAALVFCSAQAQTSRSSRVTAIGSQPGDVVLTAEGPVRRLLTVERTMLNLLCHLSGIATLTRALGRRGRRHRRAASATPARRPPGCARWRSTRCAAAAASTTGWACGTPRWSRTTTSRRPEAWPRPSAAVREAFPGITVEVECDTVDAGAGGGRGRGRPDPARQHVTGRPAGLRRAGAARRRCSRPRAGSPSIRAHDVAATGVAYLAVGALTHSAPILDLGMDLRGDPSGA